MSQPSRFADWLDARTGYRALVRHALDEPVPGGARWAYIFGSVLVGCIGIQAITGWAMMTVYAPSATTAWASVAHLQYAISWGWLVRGMHHFGAHAMVVVLALHIAQVALYGAYRAPREVNWWLGLGLLGITLGFALTGYLLPWDQKGYWATRVATNISGTVPVAGSFIQKALQGGAEYGNLTLTRFYTLHVAILPALLVLLLSLHLALFRKHGVTPPANADLSKVDRFYPLQVAKDLGGVLLVLFVVVALALREHGAPLDAPADPSSDYPARPEWYFLSLFQLLKYFEGSLELVGTMLIPGVAVTYLVLLPLVDKAPNASLGARMRYLAPLGAAGAGVVLLTFLSMSADAKNVVFQKARAKATARAEAAIHLAGAGVPPDGPLAMLRRDPDTRGPALFEEHCASCHRLGDLGPEPSKANAPDLSGWGTEPWAASMLDNPDAADRFGNTPFAGEMMSFTRPPRDAARAKAWKPMPEGDRRAIAHFLGNQADAAPGKDKDDPGGKLVGQRCTGCHLVHGETDDEESLGPELAGWGTVAWVKAQIANPATPVTYRPSSSSELKKGHMPRFGDKLEPGDLDILAHWVQKTARASVAPPDMGTAQATRK